MHELTVRELIHNLEQEMNRIGYSDSTVKYYHRFFQKIIQIFEKNNEQVFSEAAALRYLDENHSIIEKIDTGNLEKRDRTIMRIFRLIGDYHRHGAILRRHRASFSQIQNNEFIEVVSQYMAYCTHLEYATRTKKHYENNALRFLAFLEAKKVAEIRFLTAKNIVDYTNTLLGYGARMVDQVLTSLRSFLKFLYLHELLKTDLRPAVPAIKIRKQSRIPTLWEKEDIKKVLDMVDRNNPCGKRDYAIILLIVRLGIRVSDVRRLQLGDIKWGNSLIEFVQSKTNQAVTLPLLRDVGWAIIDYIKNGRPQSDSPIIFLRHVSPYTALSEFNNMGYIISKYLKRAGVSPKYNATIGMHSLRHTLASSLLEKNVPISEIAGIMGHTNIDSTGVYLKTQIDQLRMCSLSLNPEVQHEI